MVENTFIFHHFTTLTGMVNDRLMFFNSATLSNELNILIPSGRQDLRNNIVG